MDAALCSMGKEFDILLVNDASSDASWKEILALSQSNPRVVGLDLARNYGQQGAIMAGVRRLGAKRSLRWTTISSSSLRTSRSCSPSWMKATMLSLAYHRKTSRGLFRRTLSYFGRKTVEHFSKFGMCATPFRRFSRPVDSGPCHVPNGPCATIDVYLTWFAGKVGMVQVDYQRVENAGRDSTSRT